MITNQKIKVFLRKRSCNKSKNPLLIVLVGLALILIVLSVLDVYYYIQAVIILLLMGGAIRIFLKRYPNRSTKFSMILSPIGIVMVTYWLYYGISGVLLFYWIEDYPSLQKEDIVSGMILALICLLLVIFGILIGRAASKQAKLNSLVSAHNQREYGKVFWLLLWTLFLVGNAGFVINFFLHGGILSSPARVKVLFEQGGMGILSFMSMQLTIAVVLAISNWKNSFAAKIIFIPSIILLSIYLVLSGGRSPILALSISLVVIYGAKTPKDKLTIKKVLFILLLLLSIFYVISVVRFSFHEKQSVDSVTFKNRIGPDIVISSTIYNVVLKYIPDQLEYQYGATFLAAFVGLIPSFFWDRKTDYYLMVDKMVADNLFNAKGTVLLPPTLLGELYLNFGLVGCFVGSIAFGLLVFFLFIEININLQDPFILAMVAISTPELCMLIRGPFANHAIKIILVALSCVSFRWLLSIKK